MVVAAMRGMVDFREADPLDKRWWFKLRLALDHIERTDIARMKLLYYDYNLSILSRDYLTEATGKQFTKDAEKKLFETVNLWRPWDRHDPEQSQKAQVEAMSEAWAKEFGDPNHPDTQKAIAETVRMLEKMDARARMPKNAPTVLG